MINGFLRHQRGVTPPTGRNPWPVQGPGQGSRGKVLPRQDTAAVAVRSSQDRLDPRRKGAGMGGLEGRPTPQEHGLALDEV